MYEVNSKWYVGNNEKRQSEAAPGRRLPNDGHFLKLTSNPVDSVFER